jgi:hypothetical protein
MIKVEVCDQYQIDLVSIDDVSKRVAVLSLDPRMDLVVVCQG